MDEITTVNMVTTEEFNEFKAAKEEELAELRIKITELERIVDDLLNAREDEGWYSSNCSLV